MRKVGVFICHCGINIAGTVDVEKVAEELKRYPGVAFATTYKYTCSDPGQQIIKDAIQEHGLDGVVVAACSPAMHETTFRRTAASRRDEPVPARMRQHPRAVLVGASERQSARDGQGALHDSVHGGKGQAQRGARPAQPAADQESDGHRRRHRGHHAPRSTSPTRATR